MKTDKNYDHDLHVEITGLATLIKSRADNFLSFGKMYDGEGNETATAQRVAAILRRAEKALVSKDPFDL